MGDELLGHTHGNTAGSLCEDSLCFCEHPNALTNFVIRDIVTVAAGLFHDLQCIEAVGGSPNRQRLGNSIGLHRLEEIQPGFLRGRDRRATRGLGSVDFPPMALDQSQLGKLLIALMDLGQQGTGSHADHRVFWNLPP